MLPAEALVADQLRMKEDFLVARLHVNVHPRFSFFPLPPLFSFVLLSLPFSDDARLDSPNYNSLFAPIPRISRPPVDLRRFIFDLYV